jgi:hypothetical protein
MRKLALGTFALAATATAMAQTTGTSLDSLLGGGAVGIIILGVIVFFAWRWFFGGGG